MDRQPEAPRNARLVYADGTTIPLELYYDGTDDDGTAMWIATTTMVVTPGAGLHLDWLPPRTSVMLTLSPPPAR